MKTLGIIGAFCAAVSCAFAVVQNDWTEAIAWVGCTFSNLLIALKDD